MVVLGRNKDMAAPGESETNRDISNESAIVMFEMHPLEMKG
jgi:hypothetical protein